MQWLALHLPLVSLEAFGETLPAEQRTRPIALVAEHRVQAVNRAAAECGIRAGFKRATALALAADLLLADAEPHRDAAALQAVAHAALAFTPAVALHDTHTVLLEVQASLRLFGGLPALCARLREALKPLRHHVQMAAAPTAMGAVLLAQWFPQQEEAGLIEGPAAIDLRALRRRLAEAPLWLLGPGREHWEALQGMGLKTLAELRRLPRAGVARRFGAALLDELDRAWGEQPDPRQWTELPPAFDSRLELFTRAENTDQLLHGARVLLARLVAWAQARQARVRAFTLRMLHERQRQVLRPPTELWIELAEPALDIAHLQLLLRERLGRLELAEPTLELQLHCSQIALQPPPNAELFPTRASAAEGFTRLVERLRARLGDEQVQRLVPVADHRPERASVVLPLISAAAPAPAAVHEHPPQYHRPAWLLPEPQPLAEREQLPLLHGRPLQLLSGPERIESGWWDGGLVARDYHVAQAEDGSLLWVFRERLPAAPGAPLWFLHGRYG